MATLCAIFVTAGVVLFAVIIIAQQEKIYNRELKIQALLRRNEFLENLVPSNVVAKHSLADPDPSATVPGDGH